MNIARSRKQVAAEVRTKPPTTPLPASLPSRGALRWEVTEALKDFDADQDGQLDFGEFLELFTTSQASQHAACGPVLRGPGRVN